MNPNSVLPPEGVENEEALEAGALLGLLPHAFQHNVYQLLAYGVVAAGVVVGRVLLAGDQLLGVEQGPGQHTLIIVASLFCLPCRDHPVGAGPGLVYYTWF